MPVIHVEIDEETYKIFNTLPKQVKGKFVNTALIYFLKTSEGQAIINFLCPNVVVDKAEVAEPINDVQYPNLDDWSA